MTKKQVVEKEVHIIFQSASFLLMAADWSVKGVLLPTS